jgi:quercetin dioxygenase-like cupin family protein
MEHTMRHLTLLLLVTLLGATDRVAAQEAVETRGVTSAIKIDEVVFGHLTELNGKFKLRATELTFAPDGYIGVHHHVGPGIRYVISGELTFAEGGQETVYNQASIFLKQGTSTYRAE